MESHAGKAMPRDLVIHRDDANATVHHLLRQLLTHAHDAPVAIDDGGPSQEIMLEVRMDGMAYSLVRSEYQPPSTRIHLSPREQEIVRLVAKGLPSKAIADVLDVSLWTVATHLRRVFSKLGVGSRAEMVARALHDGLLSDGS